MIIDSDLDSALRNVAIAVVSHASDRNGDVVWPGLERVGWLARLSKTPTKKALEKLRDIGFIERVEQNGAFFTGVKRGYRIHPEMLPARAPYAPGCWFTNGGHPKPLLKGATDDGGRGLRSAAKGATDAAIEDQSEEDLSLKKITGAFAPGDWFEECQRLHRGKCGGSWKHRNQMLVDANKERAAATG